MDPAGLHDRLATSGDRAALASFACTSLDPRLEAWIRNESLKRQLGSSAADDFRLLLFLQDDGQIVAVTAHERNHQVAGPDGDLVPGSYFMIVAIADQFRDREAPDGRPLIAAVLEATFADIRSRERGDWVSMMVRDRNNDGAAVLARLPATHIGHSGDDDVYVLFLG